MPIDPVTESPEAAYLVWCLGRPQLTRTHSTQAAAERDAEALARAFPNSRIEVYALVNSYSVQTAHAAARAIAPPQSPPGTQHY